MGGEEESMYRARNLAPVVRVLGLCFWDASGSRGPSRWDGGGRGSLEKGDVQQTAILR